MGGILLVFMVAIISGAFSHHNSRNIDEAIAIQQPVLHSCQTKVDGGVNYQYELSCKSNKTGEMVK